MNIESVASVAVISREAALSRKLYVDALGLPLKRRDGDYFASEAIAGCRHSACGRCLRLCRRASVPARCRTTSRSRGGALSSRWPKQVPWPLPRRNSVLRGTRCCTAPRPSPGADGGSPLSPEGVVVGQSTHRRCTRNCRPTKEAAVPFSAVWGTPTVGSIQPFGYGPTCSRISPTSSGACRRAGQVLNPRGRTSLWSVWQSDRVSRFP